MKVSRKQTMLYTISDAPALGPINFILQDFDTGCGSILIECYDQAWSYTWSAMSNLKIVDFLLQCDADYIAGKLLNFGRKVQKKDELCMIRIIGAIKTALQSLKEQEPDGSE